MAFMDSYNGDEEEPIMTAISVHSPVIQNSRSGTFYTSYAISLKSNNSCFTLQQSCIRRRYSEFVHLRGLLKIQHPTIDPPILPPRNFFSRFNATFVAQRAEGLEIFLKKVLDVPVYLSNKGVHLFLQTHFSMPEIDKLVTGDIPAPQLIGVKVYRSSLFEESGSHPSTETDESNNLPPSVNVHLGITTLPLKPVEKCDAVPPSSKQLCSLPESRPISITTSPDLTVAMQTDNLSTGSSLLSDTSDKSLSSASSSPDSEKGSARRVSFNDKVTVAVVKNRSWNYDVKPIKTGAC